MKYIIIIFFSVTVCMAQNNPTKPKPKPVSISIAADAINYAGSDKEDTLEADGKDVLIAGNNNKLVLTGNVNKLLVTGKDNDLEVASVKEIIVSGNGNFISWERSGNTSGKPLVKDSGGYNNIGKKSGNALNKSEN